LCLSDKLIFGISGIILFGQTALRDELANVAIRGRARDFQEELCLSTTSASIRRGVIYELFNMGLSSTVSLG
jgi:hypothetical protein